MLIAVMSTAVTSRIRLDMSLPRAMVTLSVENACETSYYEVFGWHSELDSVSIKTALYGNAVVA